MKYWLALSEHKNYSDPTTSKISDWDSKATAICTPDAQIGDAVILWREGRCGGIVAFGKIATVTLISDDNLRRFFITNGGGDYEPEPTKARIIISFDKLNLTSPITAETLRTNGFARVAKQARKISKENSFTSQQIRATQLEMPGNQWQKIIELADQARPLTDWPGAWNISPGSVVNRQKLHEIYGGNGRLTASSSGKTPNCFIFLNPDSENEFTPRQNGDLLLSAGHKQRDDSISLENKSALSHLRRGLPLRVFIARRSECLYLGQFSIDLENPIESWMVTGKRTIKIAGTEISWKLQTPIFRLHKLDGLDFSAGLASFHQAPRIDISLHPSTNQPAAAMVRKLLHVLEREPATAEALGALDEADLLAAAVTRARRQADLNNLRSAVEDPNTKEHDLQKIFQRMTWIFGADFYSGTARRNLTAQDQLDLVLIRPDGTLHGVELKRANVRPLVTAPRGHLIPGAKVHEAYCQALVYVRELDEHRAQIRADWNIDCRRASMTVVIGHIKFAPPEISSREVNEAFRTYNSDHSRVTVTTYDRLIDNAQRGLELRDEIRPPGIWADVSLE
ncbi:MULTISPECIES: Shedu anti-phage system protein SduA domain-containing protein [unclassified Streptomyces]|uniref:Shedu anti-phage system protein SduA domain-containing protein n=1 Tax=unclassified Streptomyces TaxID=2593676 RepID=UPI00131A3214|nr:MULTISPECIES: Shedu anti-phage system protein SduA domain-containing protein [unclassified Streptomyces]MYQ75924.1 DUF4263 domain-containing protein [Streptomyces sp. SID4923]